MIAFDYSELDLKLDAHTPQTRTCWAKANGEAKENFKTTLALKLNEIPEHSFVQCHNVHCQSHEHVDGIEEYTLNILEAMEKAGHECLPKSGGGGMVGKKLKLPGWSEHVKPYADESNFWYKLWLSAGKPGAGDLFENMKQSKRQFKFAVRRLKRCKDKIQNHKFTSLLLSAHVACLEQFVSAAAEASKS